MKSLNLATAFTFMLSGCFNSLPSLRFVREIGAEQSFQEISLILLVSSFFFLVGGGGGGLICRVSLWVRQLLNSKQFDAV